MSAKTPEEMVAVRSDYQIGGAQPDLGHSRRENIDVLFDLQLPVGLAAVSGEPNALLVAEVDHGEGGVVGHVAGSGALRSLSVLGFKRGDGSRAGAQLVPLSPQKNNNIRCTKCKSSHNSKSSIIDDKTYKTREITTPVSLLCFIILPFFPRF